MTEQPESGELLVGSYLRLAEGCELVMYNQRSKAQGDQLEIDVIGVEKTEDGERIVYTCEVVTHIDGLHYSGAPAPTDGQHTETPIISTRSTGYGRSSQLIERTSPNSSTPTTTPLSTSFDHPSSGATVRKSTY